MSILQRSAIRFYAWILRLYPADFRSVFADEMLSTFRGKVNETGNTTGKLLVYFWREIRDLPSVLFERYAAHWLPGGSLAMENERFSPSTRREAFIGALPFLAYGAISMLEQLRVAYLDVSLGQAFYLFVIIGMLIGWKRKFPLWSYAYLGWVLFLTWSGATMHIGRVYVGNIYLIVFAIAVLIGILWTCSIDPIKQFFNDIFKDWSRLSLVMYTFIGFVGLIYELNHHPYLLFFMLAATLVLAAGAWFFLRSATLWGRALSVCGGFIASVVIGQISERTWDYAAFYGRQPWHMPISQAVMLLSLWSVFLLWPVFIDIIQVTFRKQKG